MEIILEMEKKPEIDIIIKFLKEMTEKEQQELYYFIQGIKFAKDSAAKEVS